ncbi:EAL domain-containing protein [uncultured Aquabacterium sp.]|jgi:diguanylate cyclase (GGDEF)-like protein|nr:EAL domain-containing protein [uncultured Aquabacterium sp.]
MSLPPTSPDEMLPSGDAADADDLLPLIEDDPDNDTLPPAPSGTPWTVLVVDDDADVHHATEIALRGLLIEGRPLTLLHAYSRAEALARIEQTEDLAVMLLDVVMESDDAGLTLVREVRTRLRREALRIILRTGQPGYAPELVTIRDYDINDYRTKSELTRVRLFTSLTTAVRAYRQMRAHEQTRRGLEMVVRASTELSKLHGMQLFARGVVNQLCALLGMRPEGLICAQAGLENEGDPARVIAAAGQYGELIQRPLHELGLPRVQDALERCLTERRSHFEGGMTLYFATSEGRGLAAYIDHQADLPPLDRHLLEVFCSSISAGFENVLLYGQLADQAYLDPLLQIPNLNHFLKCLSELSMPDAKRNLAVVDIDSFASINDMLGHGFGDALLRTVSNRLTSSLGERCTVARVSADVFGVLGPKELVDAEPLQRHFAMPFLVQGQTVRLSATMGLVRLGQPAGAGAELLNDAHLALKRAKGLQRGTACYFSAEMGQDARTRMQLLNSLRAATGSSQLFTVYQPKVCLQTGRALGLEALLRWRKPDGELVPPDRFIPLAEQAGLMSVLGSFVLHTACAQLRRLHEAGYPHLTMAINVSQAQLREPDFIPLLADMLNETRVAPACVELEVTESMAADDLNLMRQRLEEIRALGLTAAIDDFGTGFSSLSVLRHLSADRLKIDRAFVAEIEQDSRIARMVVNLGHSLSMKVVAEGVETPAQRELLQQLGCEEGQGWLFARPMTEPDLLNWLAAKQP